MWVLAVAVLLAPALAGAAAPAAAQPTDVGRVPLNLSHAPKPDRIHIPVEQTVGAQPSCRSAVEKAAQNGRQGEQGQKAASCFEVSAKPATKPDQVSSAAPSVWCELSIERGWWLTRRNACQVLGGYIVIFDLFSEDLLGEGWMTIRQEIDNVEDPFSPYWDEDISLTLDDAWGWATTLQSEIIERCPAPCQMSNSSAWGGRRSISVGQSLEGDFDNHWNALGSWIA